MKRFARFILPLAMAASLPAGAARAEVIYEWVITNNFDLRGKPVVELDPPICSAMDCPELDPKSFSNGSVASASAEVPPTDGASPSATVYVGYAWPNGTSRNECGFTIAGGTVNEDGTSTPPTFYAFISKYTIAGRRVQPGCKAYTIVQEPKDCSKSSQTCTYKAYFSIETYNN